MKGKEQSEKIEKCKSGKNKRKKERIRNTIEKEKNEEDIMEGKEI